MFPVGCAPNRDYGNGVAAADRLDDRLRAGEVEFGKVDSPPSSGTTSRRTARAGQLRVRVWTSKANADGRREDLPVCSPARSPAPSRTCVRRRRPTRTTASVPLSPHQVNRRLCRSSPPRLASRASRRTPDAAVLSRSSSAAARRPPPCRPPAAGAAPRWSHATPRPSPSRTAPSARLFGGGGVQEDGNGVFKPV